MSVPKYPTIASVKARIGSINTSHVKLLRERIGSALETATAVPAEARIPQDMLSDGVQIVCDELRSEGWWVRVKFDDDTKWLVVSWPEPERDDDDTY